MTTMQRTLTYYVISCPRHGCGIPFAVEQGYDSRRREDHRSFYCPNGHSMSYSEKADAEKAIEERDRYKQRYEQQITATRAARDQAEAAERSARAYKGVATKIKRRVESGVCPVSGCKRHFADLQQHIDKKHPDYKEH